MKPLIIFRGKGLRISQKDKKEYDGRVVVQFQEKAWCDETIMKHWVLYMWKRPFSEHFRQPKLLVADVHRAQTTEAIQRILSKECNTYITLVPPGTTSLVQPLDVCFNAPFKSAFKMNI